MTIIDRAKRIILKAEKDLWELSKGEKVDLLLDNIPEIKSTEHARWIINRIKGQ